MIIYRNEMNLVFNPQYAVSILEQTKRACGVSMKQIARSAQAVGLTEVAARARFRGELPHGEKWTGLRVWEWVQIIMKAWQF